MEQKDIFGWMDRVQELENLVDQMLPFALYTALRVVDGEMIATHTGYPEAQRLLQRLRNHGLVK